MNETYSEIRLTTVERFRMARYVIISPNPEDDVIGYMQNWAKNSGLLDYPGYTPRMIGWDFPFVSEEQSKKFGLRGYVAAYVIPEDFEPACGGAELAVQETDDYACITITDPFSDPFNKIQKGYQEILKYEKEHNIMFEYSEARICFEEVYEKDGTTYMDVYVPADR